MVELLLGHNQVTSGFLSLHSPTFKAAQHRKSL